MTEQIRANEFDGQRDGLLLCFRRHIIAMRKVYLLLGSMT